jgi:predicted DNA-binding transcriptional regulator AlpA
MGKLSTRKRLARKFLLGVRPQEPSEILAGLDRVVSEPVAAEILGVSKDTLRRKFRQGLGPPRVRLSEHRIGYRLSAIYAHLEANTETSGEHQVRRQHGPPPSPSVA